MQDGDRNGAVRSSRDLPGEFVVLHLVRTHLGGVIPIGEGRAVDVKSDRVLDGVHTVSTEVDARAESGFFVFFRRSFEFVSGG
jgi:hypothetical protein